MIELEPGLSAAKPGGPFHNARLIPGFAALNPGYGASSWSDYCTIMPVKI